MCNSFRSELVFLKNFDKFIIFGSIQINENPFTTFFQIFVKLEYSEIRQCRNSKTQKLKKSEIITN